MTARSLRERRAAHGLLHVFREAVVDLAAEHQAGREIHVTCVRDVAGDFVETLVQQVHVVGLGAIDHTLLEPRVQLAEGHRRRLRAESVERLHEHGGAHHPDLQPAHVVRSDHRAYAVPGVACSREPPAEHYRVELLLHPLCDALAGSTVENAEEMVGIAKDER